MRVVFAGTPAVAVPSLEAIAASSHEVVAVVTRPDAPAGRGRKVVRSDVGQWADAHDVPVLVPGRPSEPEFLDALRELSPDCCPVVAYGALVPRPVLDVPKHGWVNLHFSLLPAWRGAAPVQRAVMAGDPVTGASTFLLEEGLDTGPVYGVLTETVRPRDTSGDLLDRLAQAGAGLLVATLDGIEDGSLSAVPQSGDGVSLAPKVSVEEARVDWSLPAFVVDRRVRGCTPEPGAWTTLRGERVKLGPVSPVPQEQSPADAPDPAAGGARPGTLVVGRKDVHVVTGGGVVKLGLVQPQGKRPMPAADWARGLRIDAGEVFE
ncbi:methionyl-tRNA formyltransferase [Kineosporia sp. R_H_3]|uniref:methionyl-tRNA formyltransferase n=1 Tax=Kineosporia sp. R_H_3 TaxID=1961848 RepID=UPI000B4B0D5E|nr:methionyl-tRNA formyltransferase [Kineosporia sp. R_H_3]